MHPYLFRIKEKELEMKTKINIIIILTLLLTLFGGGGTPAQAATGDLDTSFGTGGRVDTGVSNFVWTYFFPAPAVQQSDGKIVVGGYEIDLSTGDLENGGPLPQAVVERYMANGALDMSFGNDGRLTPQVEGASGGYITSTQIGSQDEIIAVGVYAIGEFFGSLFLARYDSSGVPVDGFGTDGIVSVTLPEGWLGAIPMDSALQSDGKLLIAGFAYIYDATKQGYVETAFLMRLDLTDGTLDESFGSGGMVLYPDTVPFWQITLQSDGKILVTSVPEESFTIYRFTAAGALDTSFAEGGEFTIPGYFNCNALAEGPEGKLYLTLGPYPDYSSSDFFLARLNADGSLDENFGTGGGVTTDLAEGGDMSCSLLVQEDGKVIVGGSTSVNGGNPMPALVRYTANGTLDESFSSDGKVVTETSTMTLITQLALTPGGKLLATGFMADFNTNTTFALLLRYDLDGGTVNTPPLANPGGPYLGAINTAIAFDGSGSSDPEGDPLTYAWTFGDGGTSTEAAPSHSYTAAGIYEVCLTVNDGTVDSDPACTMAVVYDPSAGFVTGGGWINSPAGAYMADPSLTGKATFGFVSKYQKGATVPTGTTQFQFSVAGFSFYSETYEWLVVSKDQATAQFKGSGTVNGSFDPNGNAFKFMLWAGDGNPDTFRIKIWCEDGDVENVVYDNGFNQAIGGGNIVVHTK